MSNTEIEQNRIPYIRNRSHNSNSGVRYLSQLSFKQTGHRRPQPPQGVVVSEKVPEDYTKIASNLYWLTSSNPKTIKSLKRGYLTVVMHLAPAFWSGYTTCVHFSHCWDTCLFVQGRGKMPNVKEARIKKTRRLVEHPENSIEQIAAEICYLKARLKGPEHPKLCVRLNCLSDFPWEDMSFDCLGKKTIINAFPDVQFYDYTKIRIGERSAWLDMPLNYHLTYSFDSRQEDISNCIGVLELGHNAAITCTKDHYKSIDYTKIHPWGYQMVDGDLDDMRFLDPKPRLVMGREKGYSKIAV